jgi:HAD superfamily hydrolase (TIGR01509 family)
MIKGIASDMDGTLIDTANVIANAQYKTLKDFYPGLSREELLRLKGVQLKTIISRYTSRNDEAFLQELTANINKDILSSLPDNLPFEETAEVLHTLRSQGIRIAIATGLSRTILLEVVRKSGLIQLVDVIVSSHDVQQGKPAPDVFLEAFRRIGVKPTEGLVMGDSDNDITPGNEIGAFTVFVSREGLKNERARFSISSLRPLPELMDRINSQKQ